MAKSPVSQGKKPTPSWTAILKALADETRLEIVGSLLKQEASVQALSDTLKIKVYNISKHLKILEETGLVEKKKDGALRVYSISAKLRSHFYENHVLDLG